ncbi:MAG: molybdopterin-dependent oxidoreductase [Acidimicrobiales bacterium]
MGSSPLRDRSAFALVGVLAAIAGMAAGHLVAGLVLADASPVVAVSTTVIESTPEWLKSWAIRRFGNSDKAVLVGSVVTATLIAAAGAGLLSRRRPAAGTGIVALLGVAVVLAARNSPAVMANTDAVLGPSVLPGAVATVVAGAALWWLRGLALGASNGSEEFRPEHPSDHAATGHHPGAVARRRFLTGAAAIAGASATMGVAGQRLTRPDPVSELGSLDLAEPAPALPRSLDGVVPGMTPLRTPLRDFYRVDTALVVPRVDRGSWSLEVSGDVERPRRWTFDELTTQLPLIERDLTLNCVSNEVGGPYVSSGRWIGVRTRDLLERAGVRSGVDQILSRSADGMTISTPLAALTDDRDAMVAIALDGAALPRARGYPARLLTPGLYGFVGATKWLVGLKATTYEAEEAYWTRRGWSTDAPVKTQSRIDTPRSFAEVPAGTVRVGGVAWAQGRGIDRVEVRVDDGPWTDATLGLEVNIDYWRQWYCDVEITAAGRHDLTVRATDGGGQVQTAERARPFPDGASGHASVSIRVA